MITIEGVLKAVFDWIDCLETCKEPQARIDDAYKAMRLLAGISERELTEKEKEYALGLKKDPE